VKDKRPVRASRSAEPTLGSRPTSRPKGDAGAAADKGPQSKHRAAKTTDDRKGHSGGNHRSDTNNQRGKSPKGAAPRAGGSSRSSKSGQATAGLLSRYLALTILESVIRDQTSLDTAIPDSLSDERFADLAPRDKAFARLLAMTVLRHHVDLQALVDNFLAKPLAANAERIRIILMAGAAELTLLSIAPHAAISTAVELTRLSAKTLHFDKLANAILRRISEQGTKLLAENGSPAANFPEWMITGWSEAYGKETAARIAAASLQEAALDLTTREEPIGWAERLDAIVLPTATLRRAAGGRIEDLDGYKEGGWWVQDAAAALPAKLLNPAPGATVLDLCAAPGGKTAQLCATGANVTAIDVSETRMQRLRINLDRLGFDANTISADATTWRSLDAFDHILIDAPCTATGTIRRHPDILHLKREGDTERLAEMQQRLLRNAGGLIAVGGTLLYCTCSLEPIECEHQVENFLNDPGNGTRQFERRPITAAEIGHQSDWITAVGDLRTFPFHLPHENPALAGIDGFFAARLVRTA
jgi:16S rRNA (cytosine967-C5)-methyltransferase